MLSGILPCEARTFLVHFLPERKAASAAIYPTQNSAVSFAPTALHIIQHRSYFVQFIFRLSHGVSRIRKRSPYPLSRNAEPSPVPHYTSKQLPPMNSRSRELFGIVSGAIGTKYVRNLRSRFASG